MDSIIITAYITAIITLCYLAFANQYNYDDQYEAK